MVHVFCLPVRPGSAAVKASYFNDQQRSGRCCAHFRFMDHSLLSTGRQRAHDWGDGGTRLVADPRARRSDRGAPDPVQLLQLAGKARSATGTDDDSPETWARNQVRPPGPLSVSSGNEPGACAERDRRSVPDRRPHSPPRRRRHRPGHLRARRPAMLGLALDLPGLGRRHIVAAGRRDIARRCERGRAGADDNAKRTGRACI